MIDFNKMKIAETKFVSIAFLMKSNISKWPPGHWSKIEKINRIIQKVVIRRFYKHTASINILLYKVNLILNDIARIT